MTPCCRDKVSEQLKTGWYVPGRGPAAGSGKGMLGDRERVGGDRPVPDGFVRQGDLIPLPVLTSDGNYQSATAYRALYEQELNDAAAGAGTEKLTWGEAISRHD